MVLADPEKIIQFYKRPVLYHPALARELKGDIAAAVFLSCAAAEQLSRGQGEWVVYTTTEWEEHCGIGRRGQERIREALAKEGVIEESNALQGFPVPLRVNLRKVALMLFPQCSEKQPADDPVPRNAGDRKPARFDGTQAVLPPSLAGPDMRLAWETWCRDRKRRHKPVTEEAARRQINTLVEIAGRRGLRVAIQAIEQSIERGYQGIFEPGDRNEGKYPLSDAMEKKDEFPPDVVEVARRRLIDVAFALRSKGSISEEQLETALSEGKKAKTIGEVDRVGMKLPGWSK